MLNYNEIIETFEKIQIIEFANDLLLNGENMQNDFNVVKSILEIQLNVLKNILDKSQNFNYCYYCGFYYINGYYQFTENCFRIYNDNVDYKIYIMDGSIYDNKIHDFIFDGTQYFELFGI